VKLGARAAGGGGEKPTTAKTTTRNRWVCQPVNIRDHAGD